jgi:hypothetical protein
MSSRGEGRVRRFGGAPGDAEEGTRLTIQGPRLGGAPPETFRVRVKYPKLATRLRRLLQKARKTSERDGDTTPWEEAKNKAREAGTVNDEEAKRRQLEAIRQVPRASCDAFCSLGGWRDIPPCSQVRMFSFVSCP